MARLSPRRWAGIARDWEQIDCRELAVKYLGPPAQKAGRAWQWFCPFHADHKTPSLTVYPNGYHCFGCRAQGSQVDLVMALERIDFRAAVQELEAMPATQQACRSGPVQGNRQAAGIEAWRQAGWQAAARRLIRQAAARLDGPQGERGRAYLQARGLEPATWQAWQLGFVPEVRRWRRKAGQRGVELLGPAITLPWTDGRCIKAVQYRLLSHPALRYWQKAGGDRTLFGVHCLGRGCGQAARPGLVLVEGELNAISVWQAAGRWLDVVSFGPQGNIGRVGDLMHRLAARYARVVVWADEEAAAVAACIGLGRGVTAVRSPFGRDANDLLVAGELEPFLHETLARTTERRSSHAQWLH